MIRIECETAKGGSVTLNKAHGVWSSYAVATVGDTPPAEIFYSGINLKDGRQVQLFVNRETGLIVVDVIHKNGKSGVELLRRTLGEKVTA